ncbi:hypothetical protein [Bacillus subtilis]|uniref:hypothetical protein n=1 Tax=Bacillus subtilis TaxID=1423 RepID=UPI001560BCBA|nr:hypothetical protein [Bacillus subtilis]NRG36645.1 hypothetical protein [Bacillus subtilis]
MEYSLLENGIDSLKKAKVNIKEFEKYPEELSYHFLKDAIIFLNHGIEILLKYILSERHESLIFTDINLYMDAKEKLKNESKSKRKPFGINYKLNVFDVELGNNNKKKSLHTINLKETIKRIKLLLDIDISKDVDSAIILINNYRNHITHHSISLDDENVKELVEKLKFLYSHILYFFQEHIKETNIVSKVDAERYLLTKKEWEEYQRDLEEFYHDRAMSDISLDSDEV